MVVGTLSPNQITLILSGRLISALGMMSRRAPGSCGRTIRRRLREAAPSKDHMI
jgi:hypothetical protein